MALESPRYDWLRRALRTFLQAFVGMVALIGFPIAQNIINAATNGEPVQIDVDAWKRVLIAALFAGAVALISALQNALEDKAGVPAVLKGVATSGQNPVPDPAPPLGARVPPEQWGVNRRKSGGTV